MAKKDKKAAKIKPTRAHAVGPKDKGRKDDGLQDKEMSLVEHLSELRSRLLWSVVFFAAAFFLCFYFAQDIYEFLARPLADALEKTGGSRRMIYTALTEAFFTYVKVAAFGAAALSFPVIASQVWMFMAPGLYRHEKRALLPFLLFSPILFLIGAAMVYYLIMPLAWAFLLGFQTTAADTVLPIELEAKVGEYLTLVMRLILAFGLCFQLPVVLTLMARVGLVSARTLAKGRKYAIVLILVLAAIVTPPDVISQIMLGVPLIFLYEVSIWTARWSERAREKRLKAEEELYNPKKAKPKKADGRLGDRDGAPEETTSIAGAGAVPEAPEDPGDDDARTTLPPRPAGDGMIEETDFNETR